MGRAFDHHSRNGGGWGICQQKLPAGLGIYLNNFFHMPGVCPGVWPGGCSWLELTRTIVVYTTKYLYIEKGKFFSLYRVFPRVFTPGAHNMGELIMRCAWNYNIQFVKGIPKICLVKTETLCFIKSNKCQLPKSCTPKLHRTKSSTVNWGGSRIFKREDTNKRQKRELCRGVWGHAPENCENLSL